jgi:hypothetical protein
MTPTVFLGILIYAQNATILLPTLTLFLDQFEFNLQSDSLLLINSWKNINILLKYFPYLVTETSPDIH